MTHYFDRLCRVVIEGTKEIDISENKIAFEVKKSGNAKENVARIKIWNLSTETRKLITASNSLVRLFAGYQDNKGLIEVAQGDITNVRNSRTETEIVTEIHVEDGNNKLLRKPISLSFEDKVTLKNILSNITEQSGFAFRLIGIASGAYVTGGYAAYGDLDIVLDALALVFDIKWSVQGGIILIRGKKPLNDSSVMLLTAETGLILNPETTKKASRNLQESDRPLPVDVYELQSLLQPHLQVNDLIAVESQDLKGNVRINKISHTGDTRGNNWYSNIEVVAE